MMIDSVTPRFWQILHQSWMSLSLNLYIIIILKNINNWEFQIKDLTKQLANWEFQIKDLEKQIANWEFQIKDL